MKNQWKFVRVRVLKIDNTGCCVGNEFSVYVKMIWVRVITEEMV